MALRASNPVLQFFGDDGKPLASGRLCTFIAGTSTPVATYADKELSVQNPVQIPLDSAGCTQTDVWLEDSRLYKFIVNDRNGNEVFTKDMVDGLVGLDIPVMLVDDNWDALSDEDGETLDAEL